MILILLHLQNFLVILLLLLHHRGTVVIFCTQKWWTSFTSPQVLLSTTFDVNLTAWTKALHLYLILFLSHPTWSLSYYFGSFFLHVNSAPKCQKTTTTVAFLPTKAPMPKSSDSFWFNIGQPNTILIRFTTKRTARLWVCKMKLLLYSWFMKYFVYPISHQFLLNEDIFLYSSMWNCIAYIN